MTMMLQNANPGMALYVWFNFPPIDESIFITICFMEFDIEVNTEGNKI